MLNAKSCKRLCQEWPPFSLGTKQSLAILWLKGPQRSRPSLSLSSHMTWWPRFKNNSIRSETLSGPLGRA